MVAKPISLVANEVILRARMCSHYVSGISLSIFYLCVFFLKFLNWNNVDFFKQTAYVNKLSWNDKYFYSFIGNYTFYKSINGLVVKISFEFPNYFVKDIIESM